MNAFITVWFSHSQLTASSLADWSLCKPLSESVVLGRSSTMCDIIWTIPHPHLFEVAEPYLCRFAVQRPWLVWKHFSPHHDEWARSKPGWWMVMPHFAESHFAESRFTESHFAESQFAENPCHLLIFLIRKCRWRQTKLTLTVTLTLTDTVTVIFLRAFHWHL